ncbi:MAG TPA: hypothetical protein DCS93_29770 [Microscillaceae bacterium]|nr:hypothetical protein [Microscillaceae bacterium]
MATPKNPEKGYERFFNAFFDRNLKKVSKAIQGAGGLISEFVIPGSSNYFKALKTVEVIVDQIVEIQDVNKAFYHAIVYSTANTFFKGLVVYDLELNEDDLSIRQYRKSILDSFKKENYKAQSFDVSRFNADPTVVKIRTRFLDWAKTNDIDELNRQRLEKYFTRHQEVDFFEVLESSKTKFARLTEFLKNDSYQKRIKLLRRIEYENELAEQYLENVLGDEHGVTLDKIYIEPKFKIYHRSISKDIVERKEIYKDQSGFLKIESNLNIHEYTNQLLLKKDSLNLGKQNTRMLFLLGYPGQGKTSFCKRLIYDIVQEQNPPINQKFYFVRLKNIIDTNDLITNPLATLRDYIEEQIDADIPKREFHKSLLILDGLDELKMNAGLTDQQIDDFCRRLIDETEVKEKSNLRIIVTSRYGYIKLDDLPKASDYPHAITLQLESFDLTQQKQWLAKYQNFNKKTPLTKDILEEFNVEDDSYQAIKELLGQPILLKIIATLNQTLDKKDTKTKIYEKLFDQLIERKYADGGQISILKNITKVDLRKVLQDIAIKIFHSPYEYIHYQELRKLSKNWDIDNYEESIKTLMVSFYFQEVQKKASDDSIQNKENYAVEFLHKSLQEYLTAEKIWSDVKSLVEVTDIDDFFKKVFKLFSQKLLSAEVLTDLKELINQDKTDKIREKLSKRFTKFFPELLAHDFLYYYNYNEILNEFKSPREQSRNVFYGVWNILINLKLSFDDEEDRDIIGNLDESSRQKFYTLLRAYDKQLYFLNLKFQKLINFSLTGVDLRRVIFDNSVLEGAYLTFTDLFLVHFIDVNISDVDLSRSDLRGTLFKNTNLNNTIFRYADLFDSDLSGADLSTSNLDGANLNNSILKGVKLSGSMLSNVQMVQANLEKADLTEAKLFKVNLTYANLNDVDLSASILLDTSCRHTFFPPINNFIQAAFNSNTSIINAYTQDVNWVINFKTISKEEVSEPFNIQKYYLSQPLTQEEIQNSPNPYLKEIAKNGKPIYQIRLKPGETEETEG